MNRKQILDARIRFEPNQPIDGRLVWHFYATRDVRRAGGLVTSRKFALIFSPSKRSFFVSATRRVSKRRKRQPVFLSRGMVDYLRSRLPPEALAECARAAMELTMQRSSPTVGLRVDILQGWGPSVSSAAVKRAIHNAVLTTMGKVKAP